MMRLRPPAIVHLVIGLHARDHAQRAEARDVRRRDVLRVLDAEAAILRPVLLLDARVVVELDANRAVADRVHHHLQPGLVRAGRARVQALGRRDEQPGVLRRIVERLEHRRGVRAERAVDEAFEPADAHPLVAVTARRDGVAQPLPRGERHHRVHARDHSPRLVRALEDGEIVPRPPMFCTEVTPRSAR